MTTFDTKALRKAVQQAAMVCNPRGRIPILKQIRITATGETATVNASNLGIDLSITVPCDGTCDFFISPIHLSALLSKADGSATIAADDKTVTITADGMALTILDIYHATDWPEITLGPDLHLETIGAAQLREALVKTCAAISTEETRYYLNGIYLHGNDGHLRTVTTDGLRMMIFDSEALWADAGFIIPTAAVKVLCSVLADGSVQVFRSGMKMALTAPGFDVTLKLIDGTFPDYTRVLPPPSDAIRATVGAEQLRRLAKMPGESGLMIDLMKGTMTRWDGTGASVTAPCAGHGAAFGVNINLLRQIIAPHAAATLTGSGPMDPFRVSVADPRQTLVIMPVRM